MTYPDDSRHGDGLFGFDLDDEEREGVGRMVERLEAERPVPRAVFRGELRRHLQRRIAHPFQLRRLVAAYAGSGLLLLTIAAVGLAGVGPFAA